MRIETFWHWLFIGSERSPPGWKNVINRFLFVHVCVAAIVSWLIPADPFAVAKTAVFPAASILIGLALAWTTRATNLLQDTNFRDKLLNKDRSIEDYIYGYQLAILVIVIMILDICIMASGGTRLELLGNGRDVYLSGFFMYMLISVALRECWGVINFTNMLAILGYRT